MTGHLCPLPGLAHPGAQLPELRIPLDPTFIVATAIASRDYQDVHHDPAAARRRGSRDIFMNILTSNGLAERYVREWAGPCARVRRIGIRLGAPNYPGDEMVLTGTVAEPDAGSGRLVVEIRGANSLGDHLSGVVEVDCAFA